MKRALAMMSMLALAAGGALAIDTATAGSAGARSGCTPDALRRQTVLVIDGDLWGMVRSSKGGYVFGWSGPPVLGYAEAVRLMRLLGLRGTAEQLLSLPEIAGADY